MTRVSASQLSTHPPGTRPIIPTHGAMLSLPASTHQTACLSMTTPLPAQPALPTCCTMLSLPASTHQTVCFSTPGSKGVVVFGGSGPAGPPFGASRLGPSAFFFLPSRAQMGMVQKQQARWVPMAQQAPVPAPSPGQPALPPCCTYPSAPTFPPAPSALLRL